MKRRRSREAACRTTRLWLQRQPKGYVAQSFGAPKPEERMRFMNRPGLGQGK